MRGKAHTPKFKSDDLALIFYKIRAARDTPTRRSLMRRARIALAQRTDLTDAERHEVMAVWSKRDTTNVDSPAMRKLRGDTRPAHDWETTPAKRFTRKATGTKKPGTSRLFSEASNDPAYAVIGPSRDTHRVLACLRTVFSDGQPAIFGTQ